MNYVRQQITLARVVFVAVFVLIIVVSVAKVSKGTGVIGKEDLAGSWQATLVGDTGCGAGTIVVNFTLNSAGTGPATLHGHSGCGTTTTTGQTFTINTLNVNGSGTAGVSCGTNCGFTFAIQVSPDRAIFNMADITDPIPNALAGVAIHQ
jgi:hypothetical protein